MAHLKCEDIDPSVDRTQSQLTDCKSINCIGLKEMLIPDIAIRFKIHKNGNKTMYF